MILILALFAAFIFCGAASAATMKTSDTNMVKIHKVGCYDNGQYDPAIDGTRVVWIQTDSSGKSIYYKNLAFGDKIKVYQTDNEISDLDISGTRVVWEQKDCTHSAIYIKNVATGALRELQKSDDNQCNPAISGKRVVWEEDCSVYLKNIVTGAYAKVHKSCSSQCDPDIDGTRVVWQQDNKDHSNVYIKNVATGKFGKFFATDNAEPKIFGNKLLWETHKINGGSCECPTYGTSVFVAYLGKGHIKKVLSSDNFQFNFEISGNRIVWQEQYLINDDVYCPQYKYSIFFKNLFTGKICKAMKSTKDQLNPSISKSTMVWEQVEESGQHMIYFRNFSTGKIATLAPII